MFIRTRFSRFIIVVTLLFVGVYAWVAYANHAWGNFHWARSVNPLVLKLGDNVSSVWDAYLATASSDWSQSTVLDTAIVLGGTDSRKCRATNGRVEVCNNTYGRNGWLGVASIWASGDHIVQGTVKLNDTYFNTAKYNTVAWRNFVMCQEVGHTFGLDHQDENFNNPNLGTCMDYTNDPTSNQHPNQHDYDQLVTIYTHLDTITTAFSKTSSAPVLESDEIDTSNPSEWGKVIRKSRDGRSSLHERDFGNGRKMFTFVVWAD